MTLLPFRGKYPNAKPDTVFCDYGYDDKTRRLEALSTVTPDSRTIQNLSYDYDLVGNVLKVSNAINTPTNTALPAGPVTQVFEYDDLYQLKTANGEYAFGPGKQNLYSNDFFYDTIGNFTRKGQIQKILQPSMAEHLPKETNYVLDYKYGGSHPHAVTDVGDKLYSYDANGNMTGWDDKKSGQRRNILWNEENRVKEIDDNGKATYFLYDDAGERVLKRGQHGETFYLNRFYSIKNGELGTKSIYAGNTRVVTKLVKTPNTTTDNTATNIPGIQGLDHGNGKKIGIIRRLPDGTTTGIVPPEEKDQYFYHGDHLGSSNMITDAKGAVYQHLEYFPFGETWIDEGKTPTNIPRYQFTGKELDPETGLYYFGARYYEPVISKWISADPALGVFLNAEESGQGIYNPAKLALHTYTANNPIRFSDPDGRDFRDFVKGIAGGYLDSATGGSNHRYFYTGPVREASDGNHYNLGYAAGSLLAGLQGTAEVAGGIGGEAVGMGLDATGAGVLAGVPVGIASGAAVAHGSVIAGVGAKNTGEALRNLSFSKNDNGNGTQVTSKTLWKDKKGGLRLDVENPAPGKRPGQLHIQDKKGNKWLYNSSDGQFKGAPKKINELAKHDNDLKNAIQKGMKVLGE